VAEGRRVLLTGVAGQLAGLVARELEQRDDVTELIGVDVREPHHDLRRTEFVRADLRNPLVARILEVAAIDTVVHLSTTAQPGAAGGRARMKERNVIGAMQLLAACQRTPTLRRFVLKSTTAVYGSHHSDPALFREDATTRAAPKHGYGKDATEIEGYVRSFARRRPDVDITILRFANLLGGRVDSAFLSLFSLPVVPRILGYDPRLQFCHEDDAVAVLVKAAMEDHPGTYNVAGAGMLYLSQCIRLAGRARCRCRSPWWPGSRTWRAARAGRTCPPTSCASCCSAVGSTPPGCARTSASPRATAAVPRSRTSSAGAASPACSTATRSYGGSGRSPTSSSARSRSGSSRRNGAERDGEGGWLNDRRR
jgi:nucleoside-diphosphate-sugar epimerase